MSEYLQFMRERRDEVKRLTPVRREAVRPLRELLSDFGCGSVYYPDISAHRVGIDFVGERELFDWDKAGDEEYVISLMNDMLCETESHVATLRRRFNAWASARNAR